MFIRTTSVNCQRSILQIAFKTDESQPWVLPAVKEAEERIYKRLAEGSTNHEYLPLLGNPSFISHAMSLMFGEKHQALVDGKIFGVECLGGTGCLRVGFEFLSRVCKLKCAYISSPTWGNHKLLLQYTDFEKICTYRYWDYTFYVAPEKAVILFHGCAHNPTGMDLNHEQWKRICEIVKRKNLIAFFDLAYQGFASGDFDNDAWAPRYFAEQNLEILVAQSFSKNFGLYNERVGNLSFVVKDKSVITACKSQLTLLVRANWSNPPNHGSLIVETVLSDPGLREKWLDNVHVMASRIKDTRKLLRQKLEELKTPGSWSHITEQIGMFSFTGLNAKQVEYLREHYHIYMLGNGRINMCGITTKNIDYVAKAFHEAVVKVQ
ncbi:unnamed protein product [Soboliphyme baturini]|uniref:Aspartate aminotransferase n=1 Tax=Soboliphyme baturini TaxID=241478 RepID=A0A183IGY5_9BILA|nr:unnamed protein product [Soboliphyme baturini]